MSAMIFNGRQVDTAIWPQAPGTASNPYDNGWKAVDFDTMLTPGFTRFAGEIAKTKEEAEAVFGKDVQAWERGWVLTMTTINLSVSQIVCFDIAPMHIFARYGTRSDNDSPLTFDKWQKVALSPAVSGTVVTTGMLNDALSATPMTLDEPAALTPDLRDAIDRRVRAVLADTVERITVLAGTVGGGLRFRHSVRSCLAVAS